MITTDDGGYLIITLGEPDPDACTPPYRQHQTKAPNAAHNQAPAARNALMILYPSRSSANADKPKARPVMPVRISTHVAVAAGMLAFNAAPRFPPPNEVFFGRAVDFMRSRSTAVHRRCVAAFWRTGRAPAFSRVLIDRRLE